MCFASIIVTTRIRRTEACRRLGGGCSRHEFHRAPCSSETLTPCSGRLREVRPLLKLTAAGLVSTSLTSMLRTLSHWVWALRLYNSSTTDGESLAQGAT
ncbi:hypothetical protein PHLGIDRAFT_453420 [Phlebiopsis gigantea 11061_1 CR5-6]|uniref:Uncharacterized protein n=1 Tax=Phlebiopsis gigantea (strain 11061_1 CR5-6) TaxID=745531 RepID=A0A0C3NN63_PHLG1|nr:hypothetical protein PHLGIDRAFT_453420 [Phlebiopsis gigantea 11061_1 CR5-6]